ncbi:MAG: class I SAM-dependent methyltransferase [Arenicellales bacterium]
MFRKIVNSQKILCKHFDRLFIPNKFTIDGNHDYKTSFVPKYLTENIIVYDVGGGKNPFIGTDLKKKLGCKVIGIDIDESELLRAPKGLYDDVICADITRYEGQSDGDIVLCRALLEHVPDQDKAIEAIASLLKKGGYALIFVPSRNALFARLNLMLPEKMKKSLISTLQPKAGDNKGFTAFYDKCTPNDFRNLAAAHHLEVIEERFFYQSSYFNVFFPAYFLWRMWGLAYYAVSGDQAAETFSICLKKR